MPRSLFPYLLALALLTLAAAAAFVRQETRQERSLVAEGERIARESGCFACHAYDGQEPRGNFRAASSGRYRPRGIPTFWENGIARSDVLKEWIREGVPEEERERHRRYLIQMPAYGDGYLTEDEIEAVAAWILARGLSLSEGMGNALGVVPESVSIENLDQDEVFAYGDRIARQFACYQCHGEMGQGGVANPKSFKGYIPGFFGADFRKLTDGGNREEIRHWIDHGRGRAIERGLGGRVARFYFDGQATGMPGYEGLIRENEKAILVEYLLALNELGPLGSYDFEALYERLLPPAKNNATPDLEP